MQSETRERASDHHKSAPVAILSSKSEQHGRGTYRDIISGDHVGSQKGSFTSSDRRIKTNIVDIDDASALETLLLLKPKTYTYKDTIGRGEDPVYGFIAQEVQETLPYSTIVKNDFIPNIYEVSNISNSNVVTFTNFNTADLVGKHPSAWMGVVRLTRYCKHPLP